MAFGTGLRTKEKPPSFNDDRLQSTKHCFYHCIQLERVINVSFACLLAVCLCLDCVSEPDKRRFVVEVSKLQVQIAGQC